MAILPPTEDEIATIQAKLFELHGEHRDLHAVIAHLEADPPADQLLIRRMKKRKLLLKDRILQLEALLVPDIPA